MANEVQSQAENIAPEPEVTPAEIKMSEETPKSRNKTMIALFSGVLIFAIVLLAAGGYVYLISKQNSKVPQQQYTQTVSNPTQTQETSPTPVTSVESSSDLDSVLNEINSATDKDLQSDLNQANSEGKNL